MEGKKKVPVDQIIDFKCCMCKMKEKVHYMGATPPYCRTTVQLKYPSYVMKGPFNRPGEERILVLGSDCGECNNTVCISQECSIFYKKTYCLGCAKQNLHLFPSEIIQRINKK